MDSCKNTDRDTSQTPELEQSMACIVLNIIKIFKIAFNTNEQFAKWVMPDAIIESLITTCRNVKTICWKKSTLKSLSLIDVIMLLAKVAIRHLGEQAEECRVSQSLKIWLMWQNRCAKFFWVKTV